MKHKIDKKNDKNVLGIYCRVSTPNQVEFGVSLEDQEQRGISQAKLLGWEYEVFIDGGVSGGLLPNERPEFDKLLTKCLLKEITGIFTTDIKRLSRNADDGLISLFISKDIKLFDLKGLVDLQDPTIEFIARIMKDVAHLERVGNKGAIIRALERNIIKGQVTGGPLINYGYKNENKMMLIDEVEEPTVKLMYELALQGNGTKVIANRLNELGIPTKRGNVTTGKKMTVKGVVKTEFVWRDATVYRILTNSLYKGERVYKGVTYYNVPGIIDPIVFDLLQVQLATRNQFKDTGRNKYSFLLKGLIDCPNCGGKFYGHKRPSLNDNAYVCNSNRYGKNCGARGINIEYLDELVTNSIYNLEKTIETAFSDIDLQIRTDDVFKQLTITKNRIAVLEKQIAKCWELFNDDTIDKKEFKNRYEPIKNSLDAATINVAKYTKELSIVEHKESLMIVATDGIKAFRKMKNVKEKTDFIRKTINAITVSWSELTQLYNISIDFKLNDLDSHLISQEIEINRNGRKNGKAVTKTISDNISFYELIQVDEDGKIQIDMPNTGYSDNANSNLSIVLPRKYRKKK